MPEWLKKFLYSLNPDRLQADDLVEVWYVEFLSAQMLMSDEDHTIAGRVKFSSVPASEIGLTGREIPYGASGSTLVIAMIESKGFSGTSRGTFFGSAEAFENKFASIPVKTSEKLVEDGLAFLKLFEEHYDSIQSIIDRMKADAADPE